MLFYLMIGDYLGDGHGKYDSVVLNTNASRDTAIHIYNKMIETFKLNTVMNVCGDDTVPDDIISLLEKHNIEYTDCAEYDRNCWRIYTTDDFVELVLRCLNYIGKELNVAFHTVDIEVLNRHMLGYGLFNTL